MLAWRPGSVGAARVRRVPAAPRVDHWLLLVAAANDAADYLWWFVLLSATNIVVSNAIAVLLHVAVEKPLMNLR